MEQHPLWHVCGIGLFILLAAIQRRASSSGILAMALWNLTGVILHELAHLLAGLLFRARPAGLSLFPRREGNFWRLGSVSFARITAFNAVPVAFAPLGLVGLAYWLARNWFTWCRPSLLATLALYAAVYLLLYNALPSSRDLRLACNWRSIVLYSLLAAVAWYFRSAAPSW
jgi:hypothetical protein